MRPREIILRHIDLYLGATHALRDFAWQMRAGQNWCLLGPNGSGKSALIKLLTGERYPAIREDAEFKIGGWDRLQPGHNLWDLRRAMGVVSPEIQANYLPETPGLQVVLSGYFASNGLYEKVTRRQTAAARESMRRLGVLHLARRPISAISYGEARRLLIARALIHDPALLVFDEPTNGLDIGAAESFLATIDLLAAAGYGIVIVTHHVHEILDCITHVGVLREGRLLEAGPKHAIVRPALFRRLYGMDLDLHEKNGRYWALPRRA